MKWSESLVFKSPLLSGQLSELVKASGGESSEVVGGGWFWLVSKREVEM